MAIKFFKKLEIMTNLVVGKGSDQGIKIDHDVPTYSWHDLIGLIKPDVDKQNSPILREFQPGCKIREYAYTTDNMIDCVYHVPHDYAIGTDMFIHVHWGHNGTTISGTNGMRLTYSAATRTGVPSADTFAIALTGQQDITLSGLTSANTPQYAHRVDEILLSDNGGTGAYINTNDIFIDGLILVNLEQITVPTIDGGPDIVDLPFIFTVDIHYQSTNIGTKSSAPDYYS